MSILICSNHGPATTDELLESIAAQDQLELCEVIFVDNGISVERALQIRKLIERITCKTIYVIEPTPGIWHARRKAILSASGEWFFSLDDDNILEHHALVNLLAFCALQQGVGGITPRVRPRWDGMPPAWLRRFGQYCLSYTDTGHEVADAHEVVTPVNQAPYRWAPGGGMVIHREAGEEYLRLFPELPPALIRKGYTAEDQLLFQLAGSLGRGYAYVPSVVVYHDLPAERLRLPDLAILNSRMLEAYGHFERYRVGPGGWRRVIAVFACVTLGQMNLLGLHPATWLLVAARLYGFIKTYFFLRSDTMRSPLCKQ